MSINENPRGHTGDIIVNIQIYGHKNHTCAISHRRHTRGSEREKLKQQLGEFTPTNLYTKKMAAANEGKLHHGNFDEVPSVAVLQKISSQKNLEDRLDNNPFIDLFLIQQKQDTDHPQKNLKHHYLQFLAMSPFTVHMYSSDQLCSLKQKMDKRKLYVYLDATGTVVSKPPNSGNVLYYALCMPMEGLSPTVLPVSEMITSDQTSVNIQNWLNCFCRDYMSMFKQELKPIKVETDFSWAIIHAALASFTKVDIHDYLQKCYQVCQMSENCNLTVIHICASHMIKIISDKVSKIKCPKRTKSIFMYGFALLQNSRNLAEIQMLLTVMCNVFTLRDITSASNSINELQAAIQNAGISDEVKAALETAREEEYTCVKSTRSIPKGIVRNSPFFHLYKNMMTRTETAHAETGQPTNPHFCPELFAILKPYLGTLPLWSGIMLGHMGRTRDTNAFVENWFRTTKKVALGGKLHRQPGQFVQIIGNFVLGRLKGENVFADRQAAVSQGQKKRTQQIYHSAKRRPGGKGR